MTEAEFNNLLTSKCVVSEEVHRKIKAMYEWYNSMPLFVDVRMDDGFFGEIDNLNKSFLPAPYKEAICDKWLFFVEWVVGHDATFLRCARTNPNGTETQLLIEVEVEK
jgi:hypothetical protein